MDLKEFSRKGGQARARNLSKAELQAIGRKGGIASGKVRRKKAKEKARQKAKEAKAKAKSKTPKTKKPAPRNQREGPP